MKVSANDYRYIFDHHTMHLINAEHESGKKELRHFVEPFKSYCR